MTKYIICIIYKLSIVNIYDIVDRLVINEDNILIDIKSQIQINLEVIRTLNNIMLEIICEYHNDKVIYYLTLKHLN
jgi:hypothetical protein